MDLVNSRMQTETTLFEQYKPIVRSDRPHRTDVARVKPDAEFRHHLYGKQEGVCEGCKIHFPLSELYA